MQSRTATIKRSRTRNTRIIRYTKFQKLRFWMAKNFYFRRYFGKVEKAQQRVFSEQYLYIMDKLKKQSIFGKGIDLRKKAIDASKISLNLSTEMTRADKEVLPILKDLFKSSAEGTLNLIGIEIPFNEHNGEVVNQVNKDFKTYISNVTATTNKKISDAVRTGIAQDEGYQKIANRIQNVFDEASNYRARMIAVTETAKFNTNASEQAMIQSGVVNGKEWLAEPDACDDCRANNGKQVELGDSFGGDDVPLHPNCRCDILPVLEELNPDEIDYGNPEEYYLTADQVVDSDLAAEIADDVDLSDTIDAGVSTYTDYLSKEIPNQEIWNEMGDIKFTNKLKSNEGIELAGRYKIGDNSTVIMVKKGVNDTPDKIRESIVHEMGHHIQYVGEMSDISEVTKDNAKFYVYNLEKSLHPEDTNWISQYAKFSDREHFAEGFTAYMLDPAKLKKIEPGLFEIMQSYDKNLLKATAKKYYAQSKRRKIKTTPCQHR